jgi:hypothetical protein
VSCVFAERSALSNSGSAHQEYVVQAPVTEDAELADLSASAVNPIGLGDAVAGGLATIPQQPRAARGLRINGGETEEFPFLTLAKFDREIQEAKQSDGMFSNSQKGKCTANLDSLQKLEQRLSAKFSEGKRKLMKLHEHLVLQTRFWKTSRVEERKNSDQAITELEERATEYTLFQQRNAENVEAMRLFLWAGRLICDYLRDIKGAPICRTINEEPVAEEEGPVSADQDEEEIQSNKQRSFVYEEASLEKWAAEQKHRKIRIKIQIVGDTQTSKSLPKITQLTKPSINQCGT